MTKKSLPQSKVKKTITPKYSLKELKEMRAIVVADLINSLKKSEDGKGIKLDVLGTFEKTQHRTTIRNNKLFKKANGKTYQYYRINFRSSSFLKRELDK